MSTDHPTTARVVNYYRRSTSKQEASLGEQQEWARTAIKAHGLILLGEFEDDAIAGSEVKRRTGLQDMISFCERLPEGRHAQAVVVWDLDRFSRASSIRTGALIDRLMQTGITWFITPDGWIDLEDDADLAMLNLQQDFGRKGYSRSIGKNVARNHADRARKGFWVCGNPPYGYVVGSDGKLAIQPEEAEVVRWLFHRYTTTADSLGDLARSLNARKITPPGKTAQKSSLWRRDTIHRYLTNRTYIGALIWNKTHQGKYYRIDKDKPSRVRGQREERTLEKNIPENIIVVENAHPAIIDAETFAEVRTKLTATRWKRTTPHPGGGEWLLSGLVHCGDCAGSMTGRTEVHNRRKKSGPVCYTYRRYFCQANAKHGKGTCHNNSVLQDTLLSTLASELRARLSDPARLAELESELELKALAASKQNEADAAALSNRIAALDAEIRQGKLNLLKVSAKRIADVEAILEEKEQERERLIVEQAAILQANQQTAADTSCVREALGVLAEIEEAILEAPPDKVRTVVGRLVTKITVVFDHSGPKNKTSASYIDVELTPEVSNLLPSGATHRY